MYLPLLRILSIEFIDFDEVADEEVGVISEFIELVALFKSLIACHDFSESSSTQKDCD